VTVSISLNRQALHDLIDKDPEFSLELKQAVLAEVARRIFEKDFKKVIAECGPELFREAVAATQANANFSNLIQKALNSSIVDPGPYYNPTLKTEVREKLNQAVATEKNKLMANAAAELSIAFATTIQNAVDKIVADYSVEDRIEKRITRLTNEAIDKMVDDKVNARLADIKAALAA